MRCMLIGGAVDDAHVHMYSRMPYLRSFGLRNRGPVTCINRTLYGLLVDFLILAVSYRYNGVVASLKVPFCYNYYG